MDSDPLIQRCRQRLPTASTKTSEPDAGAKTRSAPQTVKSPGHSWGRWISGHRHCGCGRWSHGLASQRRTFRPRPSVHAADHSLVCCDEQPFKRRSLNWSADGTCFHHHHELGTSWLSIRNSDGSKFFEGTLGRKTLPADANVEIYAGRPDLVLISRGDETLRHWAPSNRCVGTNSILTFTRSVSPVTVFTTSEQLSNSTAQADVLIETFRHQFQNEIMADHLGDEGSHYRFGPAVQCSCKAQQQRHLRHGSTVVPGWQCLPRLMTLLGQAAAVITAMAAIIRCSASE